MGCVRDEITLENVITNLVSFQKITGAAIVIVLIDEQSSQTLRRGLNHKDFLSRMQNLLASHLPDSTQPKASLSAIVSMKDFSPLHLLQSNQHDTYSRKNVSSSPTETIKDIQTVSSVTDVDDSLSVSLAGSPQHKASTPEKSFLTFS